uniref:Uncharacterized protein n=1 Tax=Megaselia scalaris TaxID=36166 RepID=T1H5E0_MEGSC
MGNTVSAAEVVAHELVQPPKELPKNHVNIASSNANPPPECPMHQKQTPPPQKAS